MYDETTDTPARARNSNLNEELGQVSHCINNRHSGTSLFQASKLQPPRFAANGSDTHQWIY